MKMNKKGFTLIELLAVIVILAIIALIATPIVMNLINKARKSSSEDSAYGIVKAAETFYAESLLETDGKGLESESEDGSIEFTCRDEASGSESAGCWNGSNEIKFNGTKPSSGTVTITKDGKVVISNLKINNYTCNPKADDASRIECE